MTEMEPTQRIPTSAAALALGVPVGRLSVYVARWRELPGGSERVGSGQRRHWTARDVVVMGMLLDTSPVASAGGSTAVAGDLRLVLAEAIYTAPWGTREVRASDGTFTVSYRPRWGTGHTAAALATEPTAVASSPLAAAG